MNNNIHVLMVYVPLLSIILNLTGTNTEKSVGQQTMNQKSTATIRIPSETKTIYNLLPSGYTKLNRRKVSVDGEEVTLIRHERTDGRNKGIRGEHISFLFDQSGKLKGFMRADLELIGTLPSREHAKHVALNFLQRYAPDLISKMEISWIESHEETIKENTSERNETKKIIGMKVKCRNNSDGRWFWVIVGHADKIMTFERDITWITLPGHRKTEKWLDDSWLIKTNQHVR